MCNHPLREIREQLDALPGKAAPPGDPLRCYEAVEERAISVLDSRFSEFEDGLLEEYLLHYLLLRRYEYSLVDLENPDPVER